MFEKGYDDWIYNLLDFLKWCDREIEFCKPKGFAPDSLSITSGRYGFYKKYPTFEEAYKKYMEYFERKKANETIQSNNKRKWS